MLEDESAERIAVDALTGFTDEAEDSQRLAAASGAQPGVARARGCAAVDSSVLEPARARLCCR